MATRVSLEFLKKAVTDYSYDYEACGVDIDRVFEFLINFDLLNLKTEVQIDIVEEVESEV